MQDLSEIETVGVVGVGKMGQGIGQVSATSGYEVLIHDIDRTIVDTALESIEYGLEEQVARERLPESEAEAALERTTGTTNLADLAGTDLVIEAIVEDLDAKQDVFEELDGVTDDGVILATNTSTLSITSIASATDRPELVVGIHFMNPVAMMEGVEVVPGERTAERVVDFAHGFAETLGKTTWESADKPGFVVNRILMPWINEGIRAYDEGVASKSDIDRGMKLGTNVPMGPLELADHIGLDIVLEASETLQESLGDRYRPAYLLCRKVEAGHLGKKTGVGFYDYGD